MSKELETKRASILKEASASLREAAEYIKSASSALNHPPVEEPPVDVETLKQALLQQIADDEARIAELDARS